MGQTVRLFIALELESSVRLSLAEPLATIHNAVLPGTVRWVPLENIHLTIKFLGDVPLTHVETIRSALGDAVHASSAFSVKVTGVGCFPNAKRPRVIWLGLDEPMKHLNTLHLAIEAAIAPLGYPTEARPFSPHLTIGRLRNGLDSQQLNAVGQSLARLSIEHIGTWHCTAVSLMKSNLHPSGAQYSQIMKAPLITINQKK